MNERALATLENCRYCLMCRHVDPVSHVTHRETLTPHGIALTVVSQQRGLIDWTPELVDVVYSESDAGLARANCVSGQPFSEAVALIKAELVAKGLAPAIVHELDEQLRRHRSPFGENPPAPSDRQGATALFVGDEPHYLWPAAIEAAYTLLEALGEAPVMIGRGCNNGFLASSLGLRETAREQAEAIITEVRATGATRLVALSPADRFAFTQLFEERLEVAWPTEIEVLELCTLLVEALQQGQIAFTPLSDAAPTAYVDPTHAVRLPGRFDAPRKLLEAVLAARPKELFWRRERAHPVGSTALQFTHPQLAEALTRARLEDAHRSGAEVVVCEDAGSLAQLAAHAAPYGLRVQGLYELLAAQLVA